MMDAIILPVTLASAAACALLNLWLAVRIGQVRRGKKVSIGDGGDLQLIARMRAQSNFIEYAPFVLILIALIELAVGTELWLWGASVAFIFARILHPFGMDGWSAGRGIGIAVTMVVTLGLAGYAATIPFQSEMSVETITLDPTVG